MVYSRSLTIVLVLGCALQPSQGFAIHHAEVTRNVDLAANASHTLPQLATSNASDSSDASKDFTVLHIATGTGTHNPIETTAKTEEIQKNTTETDGTDSTVEYITTTDSETETTTGDTDTSTEYETTVKSQSDSEYQTKSIPKVPEYETTLRSQSNSSEKQMESTPKVTENETSLRFQSNSSENPTESTPKVTDSRSGKTQRDINNTNLNTTPKADNGTSYPTELVKDKPIKVEPSTVSDVDGTDSNYMTETATETGSDNGLVTSIPYWKKYTTIDRKRLNEEYTTTTKKDEDLIKAAQSQITLEKSEKDEDVIQAAPSQITLEKVESEDLNNTAQLPITLEKAEKLEDSIKEGQSQNTLEKAEKGEDLIKAAQSHITLEKAFSISSDIPSLEKLKNELLSLTSKIPTKSPEVSSVTEAMLPAGVSTQAAATESPERGNVKPRVDTMNSMRAGFLDYSLRTTNDLPTTAEDKVQSTTDKATETNVKSKPGGEATTTQNKTDSNKVFTAEASQSQLAEDAIKEELLEEAIIRDNTTRTKNVIEGGGELSAVSSSEDILSVKPINAEKSKTTLYTVSPNYKPMKKIEVQPSKTFARDPDDNSWRNESLSSMGIVFKANNSTKPFTQVLKNKTETELNSLLDKYNENREQELRERLEKMSEKRKSKRKKVDKNGDVTYVDYEESNSEETTTKADNSFKIPYIPPLHEVSPELTPQLRQSIFSLNSSAFDLDLNQTEQTIGTKKMIETFDGDDDDNDYLSLPEVDIKKFMTTEKSYTAPSTVTFTAAPSLRTFAQPLTTNPHFPERKPTIQYFPPLQKQKVNVNDYDDSFRNKLNSYITKESLPTTRNHPTPFTTSLPLLHGQFGRKIFTIGTTPAPRTTLNLDKSVYLTNQGQDDNGFNRGSYIIKHLKEFMEDVVKAEDDVSGYVPPAPVTKPPTSTPPSGDYFDYDANYQKNIIDKFVENFNAQNERFRVDFPVVYNSSVVHSKVPKSGMVQASSSAFMRRLFDDAKAAKARLYQNKLDPNCDRTVELSPAYELHYYVPEDEETGEPPVEQKPVPFRYQRPRV